MNEVELLLKHMKKPEWADALIDFTKKVLEQVNVLNRQLSLVLADEQSIREYNQRWRNMDEPTDVLSFAQDEGESIPLPPGEARSLGDLVISPRIVARNSEVWGVDFIEELKRVTVHGILHLMGYTHDGGEEDMFALQEDLLKTDFTITKNHG